MSFSVLAEYNNIKAEFLLDHADSTKESFAQLDQLDQLDINFSFIKK